MTDQVKDYTLEELKLATNNFSDDNILGKGAYGTVYRGQLTDGNSVAIKRLDPENIIDSSEVEHQFLKETSMPQHPNLLPLIGFCKNDQPKERLLVTPLMENGSLASCLEKSQLDWNRRKIIAHGTAAALAYLHHSCNPKIIHRDIKPDNVLINENFKAVVADFGFVRLIDNGRSHVSTYVYGTRGYIPPEYLLEGRCWDKTDVYAYGILLFEIITGAKTRGMVPKTESKSVQIPEWIDREVIKGNGIDSIVDSDLQGDYIPEEAEKLVNVALCCTKKSPQERPTMAEVVQMLEKLV